ncbi:MAG: septum formation initiator family protein [Pseudomonadota bacterium]
MKRLLKTILSIFTPLRICIILAVGIFFSFLLLGEQGVLQLNKLVYLKNDLIQKKTDLQKDLENLENEKKLLHDPKNLELVIRQELGFIKSGEIVYQIKEEQ